MPLPPRKLNALVKKSSAPPQLAMKKPGMGPPKMGVPPNASHQPPAPPGTGKPAAMGPKKVAPPGHPSAAPAGPDDGTQPLGAPPGGHPGAGSDGDMPMEQLVDQAEQAAVSAADPDLEDLLVDYDDQANPPDWATDADVWQQAQSAVQGDDGSLAAAFEEPYVVTAYLYKLLGGTVQGASSEAHGPEDMDAPPAAPGAGAMGAG